MPVEMRLRKCSKAATCSAYIQHSREIGIGNSSQEAYFVDVLYGGLVNLYVEEVHTSTYSFLQASPSCFCARFCFFSPVNIVRYKLCKVTLLRAECVPCNIVTQIVESASASVL